MKLKKIISVSLCASLVLSLAGCNFNPKDAISGILTGKNNGGQNSNIVELAQNVNKDAVFKNTESFKLEGFDYFDGIKNYNGKMYVAVNHYEYPDYEPYPGDVQLYDETAPADDIVEEEIPDTDSEDYDGVYEPYVEDYYPTEASIRIASFTNQNDVKYRTISLDVTSEAYFQGGSRWAVDSEENFYALFSVYDPATYTETNYLRKYGSDDQLIKEIELSLDSSSEYTYIEGVEVSKKGEIYILSETALYVFDKDLNKKDTITVDSGNNSYYYNGFFNSKDEYIFQVSSWNSEKTTIKIYKIDATGNPKEDPALSSMIASKTVIPGVGYDYYYKTNSSIMGFNEGDKEAKEVCNFYDSDVDPDTMYGSAYFISAEEFAISMDDSINIFKKVPPEEVADREVVTIGTVFSMYALQRQVLEYNRNNDKYRVKLIDYSEYNTPDDWNAGIKRFNTDITGGNAPDIIAPEAYDAINLMEKGVFTDLTPLMNATDGLKKDDLVYNAKTVFAKGDKLYCVFPDFTVEALEIKKSMYKPGMTFEDIEAWEQETGNLAFGDEYTKANTLNSLMSLGMDAFLDPSSGKCSFDSPEFVKLLEYSNKYRKEIPDGFYQDYDYNSYINMYRNDKALLSFTYLYNFREYNWNMNYRFGEETEVIGLPIDGTNGITLSPSSIMGISEKSQHKEVAWDFIKSCFTEEFYEEYDYGFPSVEAVMDKKIEEAMQKPYYMDGDEKVYYDETIWLMDREEKIDPITKDKALELKDFVVKATSVYTWDEELNKIIDEETQGYFEGQKNVEEVANIIQSRLRIYINEKK